MTTVLVCDDRDRTRRGLAAVLSRADGIDRVDSVSSARLLDRYSHHPLDVVLVGTPKGARTAIAAVRLLIGVHPHAHVVVFGSPEDAVTIAEAVAAGACGFLRWDTHTTETATPASHSQLTETWSVLGYAQTLSTPTLTERQLQILTSMSQGHKNSEIGRELLLAEDTIKCHARQMFGKLNVSDRAGAVAQGFRHNLLR